MRFLIRAFLLICICVAAGLYITRPTQTDPSVLAGLSPDPENGALVYAAMGCSSCHQAAKEGTETELPGGKRFVTEFGTFIAPNISSHPEAGIGAWTDLEIATAVMQGTSPEGSHYYPAFPYATYANAKPQDIVDLIAHLRTLPPVATPSQPHEISFPFNIRASVGGWKLLFGGTGWVMQDPQNESVQRGRYLVEALAHCAECHTPRNAMGGLDRTKWLWGAPNPSGTGRIPDITPGKLDWSEADLVEYFTSGFTPDFDTAGGTMAEVVENLSHLPKDDRAAIAAYLKAVPASTASP